MPAFVSRSAPAAAAHSTPSAAVSPRYEPDAAFKRISITQPKMDLSEVDVDGGQELWLLQLPHDVRAAVLVWMLCSQRLCHHPCLLRAVPSGHQSELDDQGGCGGWLSRPLQHPG